MNKYDNKNNYPIDASMWTSKEHFMGVDDLVVLGVPMVSMDDEGFATWNGGGGWIKDSYVHTTDKIIYKLKLHETGVLQ